jgi:predicted RNA-binding protein with PUA-like domain
MQYWLIKSEPNTYSIEDLAKEQQQTCCWDGIRNYQVRNFITNDIKIGDLAFLYHSSCKHPAIVGIVKVVKEAYPDHTAFDLNSEYYDPKSTRDNPRWFMFDIELIKKFNNIVTLEALKKIIKHNPDSVLQDMVLLRRGNRLSITPVTKQQWEYILKSQG